jgi:hypothetical protein
MVAELFVNNEPAMICIIVPAEHFIGSRSKSRNPYRSLRTFYIGIPVECGIDPASEPELSLITFVI